MIERRSCTVGTLIREGILFVEDGNHGEYRPLQHEFVSNGIPFVRPDDLKDGRVDFSKCDHINPEAYNRIRKGKGKTGDILFTHRATVGRMARIPDCVPDFVANPGVTVWRSLNQDVLDINYLYFFMHSKNFMDQVWAEAGNTDTFPYISLTQQRGLRLILPPIQEQREIAFSLVLLDNKIELNRQMNETLEAMARAIFKDWFVDFGPTRAKMAGTKPYLAPEIWKHFPDVLDDEGKPEGWQLRHLERFVEVNPIERLRSGTIAPYLEMAALPTSGPIADPAVPRIFTSGMRFRNGDTLFARITPCLENGKTAYIQSLANDEIGWGSTEFIILRARPPVASAFTYLLARDPTFRAFAIQSMTGTSGRQRAHTEAISKYQIMDLPEELWLALSIILEPLFECIHKNGEESLTLLAMRDLLLPKLMSGEISVKEAEKIAA